MTTFSDRQAGPAGGESPPAGPSPVSTLDRVARGDRDAVGECLDRHGPLVWSLARRYGADPSDAEDMVQDVFIELWKNASRFDPAVASETTFVAMIARRRLIDRARKARSRPRPGPLPDDLALPEGPEPADHAEDVARAAEALSQLSDGQRQVLGLALRDGLTYDRIATKTGLPLGTVKTHARRGLIRLRELLRGSGP